MLSSSDYNQKDADVAWVLGAAYLSQSGFGMEVRYNWGISNITGPESFYNYGRDERNRVLQLGLVYFFAIAKKR